MTDMKFGFGNVESAKSNFKEKIEPGVTEVKITDINLEEQNGKQYISIKCANLSGTRDHEERMYMSTEGAIEATTGRLKHLIEEITGKKPEQDSSLKAVQKALKGKEVRIKFTGEEYVNKDGDIRVKAGFAFKGFAESMNIPMEETGLRYNPENKYDFRKVERPEDSDIGYDSASPSGDVDDDDLF